MNLSEGIDGGGDEAIRRAADERLAPHLLKLHAAIDSESLWQAGHSVLKAAMPAFHYLMGLPSTGGLKPFMLRTTLPVPDEPDYWERLDRVAPLEKMVARFVGRKVARLSDDVPFFLLRLTPFYRKFMKPEGWRYSVGMFFWEGNRFLGQFSQNRTASQGDYTDAEIALLGELHPHFETSIRRVILLDAERAGRRSLEEAIERSPLPTAVLNWDLQPLCHNRSAAEASTVWRLGPDAARALKPEFKMPEEVLAACRVIRDAREKSILDGALPPLPREQVVRQHGQSASQASIRLIETGEAQFARPQFLIHFTVQLSNRELGDAVQMLARLTAAEREVALRAGRGLDNEEIAAELSVSRNTVRSHLRHVFEKLGITSRAKLAALYQESARIQ